MKTHEFSVVARAPEGASDLDAVVEQLFNCGCDDATVSLQKGLFIIDFDREERSMTHAALSAIQNVRAAGLEFIHLEPDHLVNLSDIAHRLKMTRATAALYASGQRRQGFPVPVSRITTATPLWDWVEVARWAWRYGHISRAQVVEARVAQAINQRKVGQRLHA